MTPDEIKSSFITLGRFAIPAYVKQPVSDKITRLFLPFFLNSY